VADKDFFTFFFGGGGGAWLGYASSHSDRSPLLMPNLLPGHKIVKYEPSNIQCSYTVRLTTSRSGVTSSLEVLSIKIDLDNSFVIQKVLFKGRGVEILSEFRPPPVL
jgi:hypothetical protein